MQLAINTIKFTLDANDHPNFIKDFNEFLKSIRYLSKGNRKYNHNMFGVKTYKIYQDFVDILKVKATSNRYLTITFNMINNAKFFYKNDGKDLTEKEIIEKNRYINKYLPNKKNQNYFYRIKLIEEVYIFIKKYDKSLYENAKIKRISFSYFTYGKSNFKDNNYKLIETFSTPKDGSIYKTHTLSKDINYSTDFKYYKSIINLSLVRYLKLKNKNSHKKITIDKELLLNTLKFKKFYKEEFNIEINDFYFKEDSAGRIILYVSKEEVESCGISIFDESKFINLVPNYDRNTNTCRLMYQDVEKRDIGYDEEKKEIIYLDSAEKYIFDLQINNLESKSKILCSKYYDVNKHYFKLGDDLEDIYSHVSKVMKKYFVVADSNNKLFSDFNPIKSLSKLNKFIDDEQIKVYPFLDEQFIKNNLKDFLGKGEC